METFRMLRHHLENNELAEKTGSIEETQALFSKPEAVTQDYQIIDKVSWQRIKDEEKLRGEGLGKIKEKIIQRDEMFSVARQ